MEQLILWANGNPGTLKFLCELIQPHNKTRIVPIAIKLHECTSIRGTNLYVLWSDLCNKDFDKVVTLCENCPNDILEDACSRQDYSGRELVKDYFY